MRMRKAMLIWSNAVRFQRLVCILRCFEGGSMCFFISAVSQATRYHGMRRAGDMWCCYHMGKILVFRAYRWEF